MKPFIREAQGFPVDVNAVVDVLDEGGGALLDDVLHSKTHLHVLGEPFDEGEKMFSRTNVTLIK